MSTDVRSAPTSGLARRERMSRAERREDTDASRVLSRASLLAVLDSVPVRLMIADRTRTIRYLNRTGRAELGALVASLLSLIHI